MIGRLLLLSASADFGGGCGFRARFALPRNRRRHGAYRHFGTWDRAGLRNDIERNQILGGVRNFRRGIIPNGAAPNFRRRVRNGQLELRFLWLIAGPLYDIRQLRHDLRRGARRIRPYQSLSRMRYAHGNRKDGLPRARSVRARTFGNAAGQYSSVSHAGRGRQRATKFAADQAVRRTTLIRFAPVQAWACARARNPKWAGSKAK